MNLRRTLRVALVAAVVSTALAGCAKYDSSQPSGLHANPQPTFTGGIPSFSGPWAEEFASAYRSTTSDVVHQILAKNAITDQDYAFVSGAYVKCMADKGYKVTIDGPGGQSTISAGPGDAMAENKVCVDDLAVIAALRNSILANPQHEDENQIVVACLIKERIALPSYTAKDYAADLITQKFPFSIEGPFLSCATDPLRLLK